MLSLIRGSNPVRQEPFSLPKDLHFPEPNPEAGMQPDFKVFLPGGKAGAEYLTAMRDYLHQNYGDQVLVPSSISHPASLKMSEDLNGHFSNLGREIVKKAENKNIHIVGHSLGGFESIDVVKYILSNPQWSGKEIRLTFIAGLGFVGEDIFGLAKTANGMIQVENNYMVAEQHTAYPFPEAYYNAFPEKDQPQVKKIFVDSPKQRSKRRQWFEKQLDIMAPEQKKQILAELDKIDQGLAHALKAKDNDSVGKFVIKRKEVLGPFIELLFQGKQMPKELHKKYMELYKETSGNLAPGIQFFISLLRFIGKSIDYTKAGTETALKEIIEAARSRKVDIKIDFALMENDYLIESSDVGEIIKGFDRKGIASVLGTFSFLEQLAHSSIGYRPEFLGEIFT